MRTSELLISTEPTPGEVQYLEDRLYEFNGTVTGITDGEWLAIFVRDEADRIAAGICGNTYGGCLEIRQFWVEVARRKQGLGTRLLGAAEQEARLAWVTIGFELLGGLAVLVGAYIPIVSIPLAAILLVAAITVHRPYGFSSIKLRAVTKAGPQFGPPGYETNLLYLAALATLVLGGSGPLTLDQSLPSSRREARKGE